MKRFKKILLVSREGPGERAILVDNTVESMLQQVEPSVLTEKPDGFVTPATV